MTHNKITDLLALCGGRWLDNGEPVCIEHGSRWEPENRFCNGALNAFDELDSSFLQRLLELESNLPE